MHKVQDARCHCKPILNNILRDLTFRLRNQLTALYRIFSAPLFRASSIGPMRAHTVHAQPHPAEGGKDTLYGPDGPSGLHGRSSVQLGWPSPWLKGKKKRTAEAVRSPAHAGAVIGLCCGKVSRCRLPGCRQLVAPNRSPPTVWVVHSRLPRHPSELWRQCR